MDTSFEPSTFYIGKMKANLDFFKVRTKKKNILQHGAAPMGGSLFMPGRRGQFLIEGIIVTVYVSLGAYSLLALHRMRLHVAQPKTLLVAAERVAEGGAHELIRVAIAGLIFAFVLVLITFLHKNYWYLRGTVLRQMVMTK